VQGAALDCAAPTFDDPALHGDELVDAIATFLDHNRLSPDG